MRTVWMSLAAVGMMGCWYERARPVKPAAARTSAAAPASQAERTSYRRYTIAADAIGVATITAGLIGLSRGANEDVSGGLMVTGLAIAGFGDPILHLAHGEGRRAAGSYAIRAGTIIVGGLAGHMIECADGGMFCGLSLEGMMWGTAAGLAVAGVADALLFHSEETSRAWTPTMSVGDGGARVGIAGSL